MKAFVFRTKRRKNGVLVKSRTWYACLRLDADMQERRLNLSVTDKRVAEEKLRALVREYEQESVGLLAPGTQRRTLQSLVGGMIDEYVADLDAMGRSAGHIRHVDKRLYRLVRECHWLRLSDVTVESFIRWRSAQQGKAAKTLNEYLAALSAFFSWLCKQNRVPANPFVAVVRVDARGKETFHRLALSDEQCRRLLYVSGERKLYYLMALHTGLRRGELNQLQWSDLFLDAQPPFLVVRAAISKNRQRKELPLHAELAECLQGTKPVDGSAGGLVFPDGIPLMKVVRGDFAMAGIAANDGNGGRIDFHALRKTFVTRLQSAGVHPRAAMELARHSEMRLTMNIYTDASHLPLAAAVQQLPRFGVAPTANDTPKDTPAAVKQGHNESTHVWVAKNAKSAQAVETAMERHLASHSVTASPQSRLAERGGFEPPIRLLTV